MPTWLTVILSVYGAMVPIGAGLFKWGRSVTESIRNMAQWFDPDSALGQTAGPIPHQIASLRAQQEEIAASVHELMERSRVLERLTRVEEHVAEMERTVSVLEGKVHRQ